MHVIGIDIGGTKIASAIINESGGTNFNKVEKIGSNKGDEVGDLIVSQISLLIEEAKDNQIEIGAIGLSVPGISYSDKGTVWAPNIPGWDNYPLLQKITSHVPKEIKVKIDSDRACYILGESWIGSAKGCTDAIFIAVGTGIGAGILINGEILRGNNDIAGAVGWLALDRPYDNKYDNYGCYEYHASGDGLARVARELINDSKTYDGSLRKIPLEDITAYHVFEGYENKDEICRKTIETAIQFWGMCAANLVSIFNPEKIIFGGGVFGPAKIFIDEIEKEAAKWAQPIAIKQVVFEYSLLGDTAGLVGAGKLAFNQLKIKQ
ncbi:MAG: ROK family protein [Ignavibacteriae bacterium]|nr:ROK family protein [Ignavibacteriota bacterium]NOG96675.1 ROK family protein [Ignavibacteriota bacterium]